MPALTHREPGWLAKACIDVGAYTLPGPDGRFDSPVKAVTACCTPEYVDAQGCQPRRGQSHRMREKQQLVPKYTRLRVTLDTRTTQSSIVSARATNGMKAIVNTQHYEWTGNWCVSGSCMVTIPSSQHQGSRNAAGETAM